MACDKLKSDTGKLAQISRPSGTEEISHHNKTKKNCHHLN